MKNLGLLALFLISLVSVGGALEAQANYRPPLEPAFASTEVAGRDKGRSDGGTHDEEELTSPDSMGALEAVNQRALDKAVRLSLAGQVATARR